MEESQNKTTDSFQLKPGETILYRSIHSWKWYALTGRIGLEVLEVAIFMLISFTALTSLSVGLLGRFLPVSLADTLSRIIFQGIAPLVILAWLIEDITRIFTGALILTDQRVWTKGFPYAWIRSRETSLEDVKFMVSHRDALFIHLRSTKKPQVHILSDSKQIVKAYTQFSGRSGPD